MNVFPDFGSLSGIGDLRIVIGAMLTIILIVAVLMIIISAITWAIATSTGNPGVAAKARAGVIPNFTGISAPYEAPLAAELTLETAAMSIDDCVDRVVARILPLITLPDPA